jgi:hypothetical protein
MAATIALAWSGASCAADVSVSMAVSVTVIGRCDIAIPQGVAVGQAAQPHRRSCADGTPYVAIYEDAAAPLRSQRLAAGVREILVSF